jgi:crossover junction endodeoxyribonuclease RusA
MTSPSPKPPAAAPPSAQGRPADPFALPGARDGQGTRRAAATQPPAAARPRHVPGAAVVGEGHSQPLGDQARTWILILPPGMPVLSPNQRLHWAERGRRARELRKAAWALAYAQKIPRLERAAITVTYCPPDRRRRDNDNIPAASGKHCVDGIVDAKVLEDDSPEFVEGPFYAIGDVVKGGQLVLTVAEISPLARTRVARGGGQTRAEEEAL